MPDLQYTERAITDLDDIYFYTASESGAPARALRFLLEFREVIDFLTDFPPLGVERNAWKRGLRALMHGRYVILYRYLEEEEVVLIERILEGHRGIEGEYGV